MRQLDPIVLFTVVWALLSFVWMVFSLMTIGRKLTDDEYVEVREINGGRRTRIRMDLRTALSHALAGGTFAIVAVLALIDAPVEVRAWASRVLFILVLSILCWFSVLFWRDDRRLVRIELDARRGLSGAGIGPQVFGLGMQFPTSKVPMLVAELTTGAIVLVNPAAERLLGYDSAALNWQPLTTIIPPRFHERHLAGVRAFLETGTGAIIDSDTPLELPALREDGSEVEVLVTLNRVPESLAPGVFVTAILNRVEEAKHA